MTDSANVFISHLHEDDPYLGKLKGLLAKREFAIRDSSINKTRPNRASSPDYIRDGILAPRIRWAGTVIVLVSPKTKESQYVQWEIDYADSHDKRIVAIYTPGSANCDLPEGLEDYADAIVAWDGDDILAAVRGDEIWQDSDGAPRPALDIARYGC